MLGIQERQGTQRNAQAVAIDGKRLSAKKRWHWPPEATAEAVLGFFVETYNVTDGKAVAGLKQNMLLAVCDVPQQSLKNTRPTNPREGNIAIVQDRTGEIGGLSR